MVIVTNILRTRSRVCTLSSPRSWLSKTGDRMKFQGHAWWRAKAWMWMPGLRSPLTLGPRATHLTCPCLIICTKWSWPLSFLSSIERGSQQTEVVEVSQCITCLSCNVINGCHYYFCMLADSHHCWYFFFLWGRGGMEVWEAESWDSVVDYITKQFKLERLILASF